MGLGATSEARSCGPIDTPGDAGGGGGGGGDVGLGAAIGAGLGSRTAGSAGSCGPIDGAGLSAAAVSFDAGASVSNSLAGAIGPAGFCGPIEGAGEAGGGVPHPHRTTPAANTSSAK